MLKRQRVIITACMPNNLNWRWYENCIGQEFFTSISNYFSFINVLVNEDERLVLQKMLSLFRKGRKKWRHQQLQDN